MAGYVCTVAGGKGGVGKTTTAINLAAALEEDGYETAVIDADLGMANVGGMLGLEPDGSIHEVLAGSATVSEALIGASGITVLPGAQPLDAYAEADPAKLRDVIRRLEDWFDVVFVDTGSGLSHATAVPLGVADGVLLVTTPEEVAVSDTIKTAEFTDRVDGSVIGTLVTRVTRRTDLPGLVERFETPLVGVLPAESTDREPVVVERPESTLADAYRQLAESLHPVFFDGKAGSEIDRAFDETWFLDDGETRTDENGETETGDTDRDAGTAGESGSETERDDEAVETAEDSDGDEGSEEGDGDEESEEGDGDEGSEEGDGDEASEEGDGDEKSEEGDGDEASDGTDGDEESEEGDGDDTDEEGEDDEKSGVFGGLFG